eukprot:TRINITY_DN71232_c0_g1_i1.p1 TRINITY_DN71232_c0_g1~~TRINITY_DN71232_c0_g1_i1.p1  ORF type:complete len:169 (-),score=31.14 TRINITY_DN71232_c0_g1_i1:158-634(-)
MASENSSPTSDLNKEKRFGQNSYYYWHNHGKDKADTGDVAPPPQHELVAKTKVEVTRATKPILKFSWCDNKKTVKVYVPWPDVKEEEVSVNFQETTAELTIAGEATDNRLLLNPLKEKIVPESSSFAIKGGKEVVLTLKKKEETSWYDLKGAPTAASD